MADTDPNPLVAQRHDSTTGYSGIMVAETAQMVYDGVQNHSWLETGLGVAGTGMEALSIAVDPVGALGSYAVGWVIEHVKPLQDALNWLAGDPDQISAYAQTWKNVGAAVKQVAGDFGTEVTKGTADWTGQAADAYRKVAGDQGQHITAAATGANTIGTVVEVVGVLVGTIRMIVRQLVADCLSTLLARLPAWLAEAGVTLGLATPLIITQASALIAKWVAKISEFITKLVRSLERLRGIIGKLGEVWEKIQQGLANATHAASDASTYAASAVRNRISYEVGAFRSGMREAAAVKPAAAVHVNPDGTMAMMSHGGGGGIGERLGAFKQGRSDYVHEIKADGARYPESAQHVADAQAAGQKEIIRVDKSPNAKANAEARRAESLRNHDKVPGKDLDEYPPASSYDGGKGASVRPISPADNRGSGSSWWRWGTSGLPDKAKVKVTPTNLD